MRRARWTTAIVGVLAVVGCQRITEELPSRPTVVSPNGPIPVIVVQVPVPTPNPAPAPEQPQPQPQPPNPAPKPEPTKAPKPEPPPGGGGGIVRVGAKVFFVECGGAPIPGSEYATDVDLGCRVHMDCQGKNANNEPVNPRNTPTWTFEPSSLVQVNNLTDFTPTVQTRGRGRVCGSAVMDGVRSNDACFNIR
jgi:hypothetical protein